MRLIEGVSVTKSGTLRLDHFTRTDPKDPNVIDGAWAVSTDPKEVHEDGTPKGTYLPMFALVRMDWADAEIDVMNLDAPVTNHEAEY